MPTDPNKYYNIRNMSVISPMEGQGNFDGWYANRENGKPYFKRFRKNCAVFKGGDALDKYLIDHPDTKAYKVGEKTPV